MNYQWKISEGANKDLAQAISTYGQSFKTEASEWFNSLAAESFSEERTLSIDFYSFCRYVQDGKGHAEGIAGTVLGVVDEEQRECIDEWLEKMNKDWATKSFLTKLVDFISRLSKSKWPTEFRLAANRFFVGGGTIASDVLVLFEVKNKNNFIILRAFNGLPGQELPDDE